MATVSLAVHSLSGARLDCQVECSSTVSDLKGMLAKRLVVGEFETLALVLSSAELLDLDTIERSGLTEGSFVHAIVRKCAEKGWSVIRELVHSEPQITWLQRRSINLRVFRQPPEHWRVPRWPGAKRGEVERIAAAINAIACSQCSEAAVAVVQDSRLRLAVVFGLLPMLTDLAVLAAAAERCIELHWLPPDAISWFGACLEQLVAYADATPGLARDLELFLVGVASTHVDPSSRCAVLKLVAGRYGAKYAAALMAVSKGDPAFTVREFCTSLIPACQGASLEVGAADKAALRPLRPPAVASSTVAESDPLLEAQADLSRAILLSKADAPRTLSDDGVVVYRLDRHARAIEVRTALLESPALEACREEVLAAQCQLQPSWANGAWVFVPMTEWLFREVGLQTSSKDIVMLQKDEAAVKAALREISKAKRPLLQPVAPADRLASVWGQAAVATDAMTQLDVGQVKAVDASDVHPAFSGHDDAANPQASSFSALRILERRTFYELAPDLSAASSCCCHSAPSWLGPPMAGER